ncbi:MAG: cytochrome c biogenesis protein CcsA [Holophagales bacterium]|nr:cytochrome c biogenesis protein CcsA [Holophagales bacterium]
MEALSQLYLPGAVPMWCAVLFALASLWGYTQAVGGDREALVFARRGYLFFALSVALASLVLLLSLYRRDFRIEYVYQYSGMDLADHFQMAAFWAGQKGSFLIWLLWAALIGIPLARSAGRDEAPTMWVYLLSLFGLLLILAKNNPFVMLPETPMDGAGLNPLLQDDWMVIHPPVMFIGYAAAAIPYSFAMAALWKGDTSTWAARAFPWTLGGFLVLGTAILMGGYWAYKTLGWGGYWGWDPVENASLIPWLIGVILIHGMYLERTRGRYRRINLLLACAMFWSVLYGTFLTRSGVLADFSVHSFVDLGLSAWLVGIMAVHGLASLGLLAWRWRSIETRPNEDPFLSRGTALVLSTIAVGLSTVLIAIGTSSPLITRWFMDNPAQVGPEFYNTVNMPLALLMAGLLSLVPFIGWRGAKPAEVWRKAVPSLIAAVVGTAFAFALGLAEIFHGLLVLLALWALFANLQRVVSLGRNGSFASAGGYLAHVGVGVMLVGVLASSAYDISFKVTLPQGQPKQVGDLTLTFQRFIPRQGHEKERMEVKVERDDGFTYLSYPKLFVNDRTRQLMANPHVKVTPFQDLYISPIQYEPAEPMRIDERLVLGKGESSQVGDLNVRFVEFELDGHDPMVRLASGRAAEVAARLEVSQGSGEARGVKALFRFRSDGSIDSPPAALPTGGMIALTGIDPATGTVQLALAATNSDPQPPRLSIDVTRKPLIQLVWIGLYIILAGGAVSTLKRWRTARDWDATQDKIAAARGSAAGGPAAGSPTADAPENIDDGEAAAPGAETHPAEISSAATADTNADSAGGGEEIAKAG